jgi:hypothetical protein
MKKVIGNAIQLGQLNEFVPVFNEDGSTTFTDPATGAFLVLWEAGGVGLRLYNPSSQLRIQFGTGALNLYNGQNFNVFSDTGTTSKFNIVGATGATTFFSTVTLAQDPAAALQAVTRQYADKVPPFWFPADSIGDLSAGVTRGNMSGLIRYVGLPNGVTSRVGVTMRVPDTLSSRTFAGRWVFTSDVAGNNFRITEFLRTWDIGEDVDAAGISGTITIAAPATATVSSESVSFTGLAPAGKNFINWSLERIGADAADTNTGELRLLGFFLTVE